MSRKKEIQSNEVIDTKKLVCLQQIRIADVINNLHSIHWSSIGTNKRELFRELRFLQQMAQDTNRMEEVITKHLQTYRSLQSNSEQLRQAISDVKNLTVDIGFQHLLQHSNQFLTDTMEKIKDASTNKSNWILYEMKRNFTLKSHPARHFDYIAKLIINKNINMDGAQLELFIDKAIANAKEFIPTTSMPAWNKMCNFCELRGHKSSECTTALEVKMTCIVCKSVCPMCLNVHEKDQCNSPQQCGECGGAHDTSICTPFPPIANYIGYIRPPFRNPCAYCDEPHMTQECTFPAHAKRIIIDVCGICQKCLSRNHEVYDCPSTNRCRHCEGNHYHLHCPEQEDDEEEKELDQVSRQYPNDQARMAIAVTKHVQRRLQIANQVADAIEKINSSRINPRSYEQHCDKPIAHQDVNIREISPNKVSSEEVSNHLFREQPSTSYKTSCENNETTPQKSDNDEMPKLAEEEPFIKLVNDQMPKQTVKEEIPTKKVNNETPILLSINGRVVFQFNDQDITHSQKEAPTELTQIEAVPDTDPSSLLVVEIEADDWSDLSIHKLRPEQSPNTSSPIAEDTTRSDLSWKSTTLESYQPEVEDQASNKHLPEGKNTQEETPKQDQQTPMTKEDDQEKARDPAKNEDMSPYDSSSDESSSSEEEEDYYDQSNDQKGPRTSIIMAYHSWDHNFITSDIIMRFWDHKDDRQRQVSIGTLKQFHKFTDHWTNTKKGIKQSAEAIRKFKDKVSRAFRPSLVVFVHKSDQLKESIQNEAEEFFKEIQSIIQENDYPPIQYYKTNNTPKVSYFRNSHVSGLYEEWRTNKKEVQTFPQIPHSAALTSNNPVSYDGGYLVDDLHIIAVLKRTRASFSSKIYITQLDEDHNHSLELIFMKSHSTMKEDATKLTMRALATKAVEEMSAYTLSASKGQQIKTILIIHNSRQFSLDPNFAKIQSIVDRPMPNAAIWFTESHHIPSQSNEQESIKFVQTCREELMTGMTSEVKPPPQQVKSVFVAKRRFDSFVRN